MLELKMWGGCPLLALGARWLVVSTKNLKQFSRLASFKLFQRNFRFIICESNWFLIRMKLVRNTSSSKSLKILSLSHTSSAKVIGHIF